MPQSTLNDRWFHKVINYFYPDNCRAKLQAAICQNKAASSTLSCLITKHEKDVIHALANDRLPKIVKQ